MTTRTTRRAFIFPEPDDTVGSVAQRVLADLNEADAVQQLLAWNLHLVARRTGFGASATLLCTDIVYVEAPPANG